MAGVVLVVALGSVGDEGGGRRRGWGVHTMNLLNIVLSHYQHWGLVVG